MLLSGGWGSAVCVDTLPNGTEVEVSCEMGHGAKYTFEKQYEGMSTSIEWGFVNATYNDAEFCNATANGELCNTCISCDDGSIEAGCTNLELGRKVECGETYERCDSLPFFPFELATMKLSASDTEALTSSSTTNTPAALAFSFLATILTLAVVVGQMM